MIKAWTDGLRRNGLKNRQKEALAEIKHFSAFFDIIIS